MAQHFLSRFERLVEALRAKSLSAAILTSPANIYYFTGFRTRGVLLVLSEGAATLYTRRAHGLGPSQVKVEVTEVRHMRSELTMAVIEEFRDRRFSIGYDSLSAEAYQKIVKHAPNILFSPFSEGIWEIRQPKTDDEIGLLTKAAEITSSAMETVRDFISPGATVGELRMFLAEEIFRDGAEGLAFNPSVMVGDDLSYGLESGKDRNIRNGDLISIKAGALVGGYHSCITRTYHLGREPPEPIQRTHRAVLSLMESFERSSVSWTPAMTLYERMVAAARNAGLSTPHLDIIGFGLGLEEVEPPEISQTSADILRESSVVSVGVEVSSLVEPCFRISDMYVVEGKYPRKLSKVGVELQVG